MGREGRERKGRGTGKIKIVAVYLVDSDDKRC